MSDETSAARTVCPTVGQVAFDVTPCRVYRIAVMWGCCYHLFAWNQSACYPWCQGRMWLPLPEPEPEPEPAPEPAEPTEPDPIPVDDEGPFVGPV